MYKSLIRAAPRRILPSRTSATNPSSARRFLSTAPPAQKSRSWKSSAIRLGLAAGGIYYYNTSNLFAEEPEAAIQKLDRSIHEIKDSDQPTIDAIVEEKRQRRAQSIAEDQKRQQAAEKAVSENEQSEGQEGEEGLGGLEDEAGQQGAFNPETGEINWDCPCLGGMAHGPCGEEFKAAFSCFVYSTEEPKGVECIEKFKGMQDCFREHPEMYGSELEDDEEEVEEELKAREVEQSSPSESKEPEEPKKTAETPQESVPESSRKSGELTPKPLDERHRDSEATTPAAAKSARDEAEELLPKAVHDASDK